MLGATLAVETGCDSPTEPPPEKEPVVDVEMINPVFDGNPEYFRHIEKGNFSPEERKRRTKTLANGEVIFEDIGLTFYKVQKGDTISEIRERLSKYPEWAYLEHQTNKLESFNIPATKLLAGMWLPIPMESKDRHLTDEQFETYAALGISDMRHDDVYGERVEKIIDASSEEEILAIIYAIAKQESGGLPLGQFELHRWEPHRRAFSFSMFHVMMEGAGLKARRNLDLTEGQLYHPRNATKIMIGFLIEKGFKAEGYLPFDDHLEKFARFYNGGNWKKTNPHYVENVGSYYADALTEMKEKKDLVILAQGDTAP